MIETLAAKILVGLALVAAIAGISAYGTHRIDADHYAAREAAVQAEIDQQKLDAANLLAVAEAANTAIVVERDKLKTDLEKQNAQHQIETDALRAHYAGLGLRFAVAPSGQGGTGPSTPGDHAAGAESAAVIQLPDALAGNLRQLALDADKLRDDYRLCYDWTGQVK